MANDIVLGIDLGTTFSSAAAWVGNQLHVVHDGSGDPRIPSVVYFPERGPPIVGEEANRHRAQDPAHTVVGIKRILGRAHDSPEARVLGAHTAFKTSAAPNGQVIIHMRDQQFAAAEVAAAIVRHLKSMSERWFRQPIDKCVLTLPATASAEVARTTKLAAKMAGLEVVATAAEPCAGALAYHIHAFRGQRKVLVYDFGGGTFDVSVLEQNNGAFRVLSTGGDDSLGGEDFDRTMANLVAGAVWGQHEVDITNDVVVMDEVLRVAERAKRMLSTAHEAPFRVRNAFSRGGRHVDIDLTMRRAEMDTRWRVFVDRSLKVTAETMMQAGLRPRNVDLVLVVGGTTYVPVVKQSVERMLGQPRHDGADPQTAVAAGAALLAAQRVKMAA